MEGCSVRNGGERNNTTADVLLKRLVVSLLISSAGMVAQVGAQDVPAAEAPLEVLEVTGEKPDERQQSSTSRVFVTSKDIERFGDRQLSEVLRRVPGLSVDGGTIKMKGLGAGYTQVLINGDPAPRGFAIDSIPPEMIDRVEVFKTPVAELTSQATAGTLNIVLRKDARPSQMKLAVDYNEAFLAPVVTVQAGGGGESITYQVTAVGSLERPAYTSVVDTTEYDAEGSVLSQRRSTQPYEGRSSTVNVSPSMNWKGDRGSFSWQTLLQRNKFPAWWQMEEAVVVGEATAYPYSRWTNKEADTQLLRSDFNWARQVGDDGKLDAKLNLYRQKRETDFHFYGFAAEDDYRSDGAFALGRNVLSNAIDSSASLKAKYTTPIGRRHSAAVGWDGASIRRREARLQLDSDAAGDTFYVLDQDYTAEIRQLALYMQDEWTLTDRATLYLGARWEGLKTEVTGRSFETVGNQSSVVSPIAQLTWVPPARPKDQMRLGVSRTYKAPAPASLVPRRYTVNNDNGPTNSDTQGNPDLKPELAWGMDFAYESFFAKNAFAGISAYYRDIDEVTTYTLFQDGEVWVNSLTNNGSAAVYGIEFELKAPLPVIFAGAPNINIRADLARNWSAVDSIKGPNNVLASQTPLSANLGFDYTVVPAVSLGISYNYRGGSVAKVTPNWAMGWRPVRIIDAYLAWKCGAASNLRVSLSNVLSADRLDLSLYDGFDQHIERRTMTGSPLVVRLSYERRL